MNIMLHFCGNKQDKYQEIWGHGNISHYTLHLMGSSYGTGSDEAGGKATPCGYATEQTTKTGPKLLLGPWTLPDLTWM